MKTRQAWLKYIHRASNAVSRALMSGRLVRPKACSMCGTQARRIVGHHPSYLKHMSVVWVCDRCHIEIHEWRKYWDTPIMPDELAALFTSEREAVMSLRFAMARAHMRDAERVVLLSAVNNGEVDALEMLEVGRREYEAWRKEKALVRSMKQESDR